MNLKCNICSEKFSVLWKFENHLNSHTSEKQFECEHCGKGFHLEWRLNKHRQIHQSNGKQVRKCHYYNNNKSCPFVEIGCKFLHEEATNCLLQDKCSYDKSQFRH